MPSADAFSIFPSISPSYVLLFQFSSWYSIFSRHSINSTIIRPLSVEFREYLDADSVFVPEGSENTPVESSLSDDEDNLGNDDSDDDSEQKQYAFPELDQRIRDCITKYEAVFPKLNFSSPKDASWILPSSSPLKCTSPADVYMLLKSSDFVSHDLDENRVFEGCGYESNDASDYELELVLRKWYSVDRGREIRCFVRSNLLLGISQRDTNYYEFWNHEETQEKIVSAVRLFWEQNIKSRWVGQTDYTFDFLFTRDLSKGHILDFNPYMPKTDPLLFTYDDLRDLFQAAQLAHDTESTLPLIRPTLRVVDSPTHPLAAKNAPAHQHNMIPYEAAHLSDGRNIEEFADLWKQSVKGSVRSPSDIAD
ncbi:D123-domain-containing protein [Crepidotus variabilis]|uniref:D123-domain-containing protein n=1 Tax=Crepidotus variabilis TaxID=179855 RepID=A0A9P6EEE1_9AGAR|nr:D123-domain-containing protein [Crepidotus variabilis]